MISPDYYTLAISTEIVDFSMHIGHIALRVAVASVVMIIEISHYDNEY